METYMKLKSLDKRIEEYRMKRRVNEHKAKVNNPEAFYRIRFEELQIELKEVQECRADMSAKYEKYLNDVGRIIERQEKDAPYIKSRQHLMDQKKTLVKTIQEIDPKWRAKIQYEKEIELQRLRKVGEKTQSYHLKREQDILEKQQIEDDIQKTRHDIVSSIFKKVY
ncbi:unnamed protein product [Moneuplotes crassus]|uniref:Uncharacterized protein n=1 Tax=Euplotes crassus TaxID=5936 RepID=A0AAD2D7R3_EUPCR|nr:unnamed protein product [Moneuplotes crassus]